MDDVASAPPSGFHSVTPRIIVRDVSAAVAFLRGRTSLARSTSTAQPKSALATLVMVTPAHERELFPALLYVYVDDADSAYRRALVAGAVSLEPPLDTPYGDRRAMVRDPFGSVFQIAHRL